MMEKFVNPNNADRPGSNYSSVIKRIKDDGACPFCPAQLKKYHKNPIIEENESWIATDNMYPYEGAKFHIIFINKKHISFLSEITPKAWKELQEIIVSVTEGLEIKGGTTFIRFGDTEFTGASVTHLHAHLVSPYPGENKKPIFARVG